MTQAISSFAKTATEYGDKQSVRKDKHKANYPQNTMTSAMITPPVMTFSVGVF